MAYRVRTHPKSRIDWIECDTIDEITALIAHLAKPDPGALGNKYMRDARAWFAGEEPHP